MRPMTRRKKMPIEEILLEVKEYLRGLEETRKQLESTNQRNCQKARCLSAWVSLYEFGNISAQKKAEKMIRTIWGG